MEITNCHVHTFTHKHTPDRFVPWPVNWLMRLPFVRKLLIALAKRFDSAHRTRFGRYAQIVETSYGETQAAILETVRGFYPEGTRFVILPMDMTHMNAGSLEESIDEQHAELAKLAAAVPEVIPFAAVDPRHDEVVEKTIHLLENEGFGGIKLYPPIGYHPNDPRLWTLYEYAEAHSVPVMAHCSRPASVQYRGEPTEQMQRDPLTGKPLNLERSKLLTLFTDPDSYVPILKKYPKLRICLAHFGGAGDWTRYIERPWHTGDDKSWLADILDLLRSGDYPGLWTDISYTVFADDENVYLLKVLLSKEDVRKRVLFGSDFYVVANAELEERRRSVRLRAVLAEDEYDVIARTNPVEFLGR
jgi:uncharacterized protein